MARRTLDRALDALLAPDADDIRAATEEERALGLPPLPTLDERVDLFLRAVHGEGRDYTDEQRSDARERILDAMASEFVDHVEGPAGAHIAAIEPDVRQRRGVLAAIADRLRDALLPLHSAGLWLGGTPARFAAASLAALVAVGVGWSATWFYAAHRAESAVAAWIGGEGSSGGVFQCGSRSVGGFPFEIRLQCSAPKATIQTAQGPISIEARSFHARATLFDPRTVTGDLAGPLVATARRQRTMQATWTSARVSIGDNLAGEPVSIAFGDLKLDRVVANADEGLLTAKSFIVKAQRALSGAKQTAGYEVSASLDGAVVATNALIGPDPLTAQAAMLVNGVAPSMNPRDWQAKGGGVEVQKIRLQQDDQVLVAQGQFDLNATGRLEGHLNMNATGQYAELAQSIMRYGWAGAIERQRLAQSRRGRHGLYARSLQIRSRRPPRSSQLGSRSLAGGPQTDTPLADLSIPRIAPLRFIDGAVYLDATPLGEIPPFF